LVSHWAAHGEVHVVGSVALDLVVEPDIDLEIYSAAPDIGKGFTVLAAPGRPPRHAASPLHQRPRHR
jgi:hypothetical protein